MSEAYLGLGGNLGNPRACLTEALRRLHATPGIRVRRVSSVYETKPVGMTEQPDFLNIVSAIDVRLSPQALLAECLRIETELGRVRRERWGPRTVDIDVLLYAEAAIADGQLTVPHPRLAERNFVVVPLAELAPEVRIGSLTAAELAARLGDEGLRVAGPIGWQPSEDAGEERGSP